MPVLPFLRRRNDATDVTPSTPAEKGGAATATTTLRDFLLVTHTVPAERVQPLLPAGLTLDRLPGPDGEPVAFLQTLCAFHEDARWSLLPGGTGQSFHQVTYRVLVRQNGKPGAWIFRTFVSTSELHLTHRAVDREADFARFNLYIDGDPARGTYRSYAVRAVGDTGITDLKARLLPEHPPVPIPFGKREDMVAFLTAREENYFRASVPKNGVGLLPARSSTFTPVWGELTAARLTTWTETSARQGLDLLSSAELLTPLCVFVQPSLTMFSSAPRLAKLTVPANNTKPDAAAED